jgi:hypothetical protein
MGREFREVSLLSACRKQTTRKGLEIQEEG